MSSPKPTLLTSTLFSATEAPRYEPVVVGEQDHVDPAQLGRRQKAVLHVGVRAETEELHAAGLLLTRDPVLDLRGQRLHVGKTVVAEDVHVVRVEPLHRLPYGIRQEIGRARRVFGDDDNLLAGGRRTTEEAAEPLFAEAVAVAPGRVPQVDAPRVGLAQQELVVDRVEHPAQAEGRDFEPGFAQLAPGDGRGLAGGRGLGQRRGSGQGGSGHSSDSEGSNESATGQSIALAGRVHRAISSRMRCRPIGRALYVA